jgi:hypothetical protein
MSAPDFRQKLMNSRKLMIQDLVDAFPQKNRLTSSLKHLPKLQSKKEN